MKSLRNYIDEQETALFNETGAFFAFSSSQFNEAKTNGVKYTSVGAGLICPSDNVDRLIEQLDLISERGIAQDVKENGIKGIIHRELANHEAQITGDISDTVSVLSDYPITSEDVQAEYGEYFQHCIDNDYF